MEKERTALKNNPKRLANLLEWNRRRAKRPDVAFKKCIQGAISRNIPFELTKEQFLSFEGKKCYYCGVETDRIGLDRYDNTKGYIMENCVSCCQSCNFMKNDLPAEVFLEKVKLISRNLNF